MQHAVHTCRRCPYMWWSCKCLYNIIWNYAYTSVVYRIAGKFGRELKLAVWRSTFATAKLKSTDISYLHIYIWRSLTKPPNLNPPICMQWRFGAQPPNLIPANISGYTVYNIENVVSNLGTYVWWKSLLHSPPHPTHTHTHLCTVHATIPYPIASSALRSTRCQYWWMNPVSPVITLQNVREMTNQTTR